MPQMFIPPIGAKLVLEKDWTFSLVPEYRNNKFAEKLIKQKIINPVLSASGYWTGGSKPEIITIPAGSSITIDRIYIRKGIGLYDSVTLILPKYSASYTSSSPWKGVNGRFWVSLVDFNRMHASCADPYA